jgi:hypothetical protein
VAADRRDAGDEDLSVAFGTGSVEITGRLDRRQAEALGLELRAIAKRYGLTLAPVRVLPEEPAAAPSPAARPRSAE